MDDFKPINKIEPDDDDFRPDRSDRRPSRQPRSGSKISVKNWQQLISRQHIMIALGIIVLLFLIWGVSSALNGSGKSETAQQQNSNGEREIQLSGSSTSTNTPANTDSQHGTAQNIGVPPISSTPIQAGSLPNNSQNRVDLPGNTGDAVTQQQDAINNVSQGMLNGANLPTSPATLANGKSATNQGQYVIPPKNTAPSKVTAPSKTTPPKTIVWQNGAVKEKTKPVTQTQPKVTDKPKAKPTTNTQKASSKPSTTATSGAKGSSSGALPAGAPKGQYTLQLSGASRSDTLNAFAKKNNLGSYWVYETQRNGKPWYVLVSGSYATSAEAKSAVAKLPAEVQAAKPWAKAMQQVKQELGQKK